MTEAVFRHPLLGFTVTLPDGWEVAGDVPPVFMPPRARERSFAPNVTVTSAAAQHVDEQVDAVVGLLERARLLDREAARESGDVERTLVHHVERGHPTALEQWWWPVDGRLWVVSTSCAAPEYDEHADVLAAVATSFVPPGGA
jgi:hypothetical protein